MTTRYLLCRAGPYHISIAAKAVLRIWDADAPDPPFHAKPVDLRTLLGRIADREGVAIALELPDDMAVLIVDTVNGMADIDDDDFMPLPDVFGFALGLFDAACSHPVGDGYPLRMRRQPSFEALPL